LKDKEVAQEAAIRPEGVCQEQAEVRIEVAEIAVELAGLAG